MPPPKPSFCPEGAKASQTPRPGGKGGNPLDPACAQAARMVQTAREHEVIMARSMMSNYTDMQGKCCGHSNDIHFIQSQYTKVAAIGRHHKRGATALPPRYLFCGFLCIGFE